MCKCQVIVYTALKEEEPASAFQSALVLRLQNALESFSTVMPEVLNVQCTTFTEEKSHNIQIIMERRNL